MIAVLERVKNGGTVAVTRRVKRVAIMSAPERKRRVVRPDFTARPKRIYGEEASVVTATEAIAGGRGDAFRGSRGGRPLPQGKTAYRWRRNPRRHGYQSE